MPLVELLHAGGDPRVDVLSALRTVISACPLEPRLADLIEQDDEAARDVVDVVVDRLIERPELLHRLPAAKRHDQTSTSVKL